MNYLLHFSIGPVQSFIAQARKTQDLYGGSRLLSEIIKKTLQKSLKLKEGNQLIYPSENITSAPNLFVIELKNKTKKSVKDLGEEIAKKIKNKFEGILLNTINDCDSAECKNQIEDFLSIRWAAVPCEGNGYEKAYHKLMEISSSVKNTRIFKQLKEPPGRKCSVCGERNVLLCRKEKEKKKQEESYGKNKFIIKPGGKFRTEEDKNNIDCYNNAITEIDDRKIDKTEGLCALCFTKRFYQGGNNFPSTAGIALMDWIIKIEKKQEDIKDYDSRMTLVNFEKCFQNFDEQLYYKENLNEEYLIKNEHIKGTEETEDAKEILAGFYRDYGKPSKYYALLMLDGDNMGKWFSGDFLEQGKDLKKFHEELSEKLAEFAQEAPKLLQKPIGKAIYSGGDDFMGFVNLSALFDTIIGLQKKFDEVVNQPLAHFILPDKKLTFSAGVVIAHYKTPLREVIKEARKMEKEAKCINHDKNGIGLAFITKSNTIYRTIFKYPQLVLLKELIDTLSKKDLLSSTFIKIFCREFRDFENIYHVDDYEVTMSMMLVEFKRLMIRSLPSKNTFLEIEKFYNNLTDYYYSIVRDVGNGKYHIPVTVFNNFLQMGDKISREIKHVYKT